MPPTIAEGAGVDIETAKRLHEAYWELNSSIKDVVAEQVVIKDSKNLSWLINPVNGFYIIYVQRRIYSLHYVRGLVHSYLICGWIKY